MIKDQFDVSGFFYELGDLKCRKYLDIRVKSSPPHKPDLMVVMMNPGSSYPLDNIDHNTQPSLARPDKTQEQIMRVMEKTPFNYARIVNLCDLRTANSNELYAFLKDQRNDRIPHSLFDSRRSVDFDELFIKNIPVVVGWGVDKSLVEWAKVALEKMAATNLIGLKKAGTPYSYYHPLPRRYSDQVSWVKAICEQLTSA